MGDIHRVCLLLIPLGLLVMPEQSLCCYLIVHIYCVNKVFRTLLSTEFALEKKLVLLTDGWLIGFVCRSVGLSLPCSYIGEFTYKPIC